MCCRDEVMLSPSIPPIRCTLRWDGYKLGDHAPSVGGDG